MLYTQELTRTHEEQHQAHKARQARILGAGKPEPVKAPIKKTAENTADKELIAQLLGQVSYLQSLVKELQALNVPAPQSHNQQPQSRTITMADIKQHVANHFQLPLADLISCRRDNAVIRPRQIAMYLCRKLTLHSTPEIGRHFGRRDHTTVLNAWARIESIMAQEPEFRAEVERLGFELRASVQ